VLEGAPRISDNMFQLESAFYCAQIVDVLPLIPKHTKVRYWLTTIGVAFYLLKKDRVNNSFKPGHSV
jgi:hypothetical protein